MPTVQCPACQKRYKLPDAAAGKVASCKCGKRFKVDGVVVAVAATSSVAPSARVRSAPATPPLPRQSATAKPQPAPAAAPARDDFWDDALAEPMKLAAASPPMPAAKPYSYFEEAKEEKRAAKKKRVIWGADWAKVGGGAMTFLVAGGITVGLVITTGYLYFWPAGIAVAGLLTCLSGLIGEEGVW